MTKKDYISIVAEKAELSKKNVTAVLDAIYNVVEEYLATEEIPVIDGLRLATAERGARLGRNPSTGEAITIPAKVVPKAKIGKALKEIVA